MKNKSLFILSLLFGLMIINSGLNKFFNYMPMPEDMSQTWKDTMASFIQIGWLFPLVGIVEIIGGILFISTRTRALGAIVILPVIIGIMLFHLIQAPENIPLAGVFMAINLWVIYENRARYMPLIAS